MKPSVRDARARRGPDHAAEPPARADHVGGYAAVAARAASPVVHALFDPGGILVGR
jgi:hypothetical protein